MTDFPNSEGKLNKTKEKRTEKSPDYYGTFKIDEDLVRWLIAEIKGGNKLPEVSLGAWLHEGKYGKFISIKPSKPRPKEAFGGQQRGGYSKPAPAPSRNSGPFDDEVPF